MRSLQGEINKADYFTIIADEATDVTHNEQMCIALHWVDQNYDIHEAALGLLPLPDTTAKTIPKAIKGVLIRSSLPLSNCVAQAYYGASNMSGVKNGVQALVKQESEQCLYVHCLAHSLNLCVQEVTSQCDLIRNCMDFMYNLARLIQFSPKCLSLFESICRNVALAENGAEIPSSIKPLCPTRWAVCHSAISSILANYQALLSTLETIQQGYDEYDAKASGLLMQMESFELFFSLKLSLLVFSAAEQFSVNLQGKCTAVSDAMKGSNLLMRHYMSLRKPTEFSTFYINVVRESSNLTDGPVLPRYRRRPKSAHEGSSQHQFTSPEDRYHHAYFEVLDQAHSEIKRRFDQPDVQIVCSIKEILL